MASYLPQDEGWLPSWLLLVSAIAIGNSIQAYLTTAYTSQVYAVNPSKDVTSLQSRTFGTYTVLASIVRFYAAYNISNPAVYQLAMWTNLIALSHFTGEWFVFGSAKLGRGLAGPLAVSTGSLIWMGSQWGFYVG